MMTSVTSPNSDAMTDTEPFVTDAGCSHGDGISPPAAARHASESHGVLLLRFGDSMSMSPILMDDPDLWLDDLGVPTAGEADHLRIGSHVVCDDVPGEPAIIMDVRKLGGEDQDHDRRKIWYKVQITQSGEHRWCDRHALRAGEPYTPDGFLASAQQEVQR